MAAGSITSAQALLDRARGLADAGDARKALYAYRRVIERTADNIDLLIEAAGAAADANDLTWAETWLGQAAALAPDDATIHLNLGEVARLDGDLEKAAAHYRKACGLNPNDGDALYGLGDTLVLLGQHTEALDILRRAHHVAGDDTEIMNAFAAALISNQDFSDAVEILRKALTLKPDYQDAWCNIGFALLRDQRYREADRAFRRASTLGGLPDDLLVRWARAKLNIYDHDGARELAEQALNKFPDDTNGLYVRGAARQHQGDFDGAEVDFRRALEIDAAQGETYERLARMKRLREDDLVTLRQIAGDECAAENARVSAGYALASYYDGQADYAEAFTWLKFANALKALEVPFSAQAHTDVISRVCTVFDRAFFDKRSAEGIADNAAIFIFGLPRSGTTLCEQILATYDEVFAGGERLDFQELIRATPDYPEMALSADANWAADQGNTILQAMRDASSGEPNMTNKTPGNYICAGLIHWLMPNARLIHCRRDPRDNALSCFEQHFQNGQSFTYDLEAFVVAYRQYQKIMAHWHDVLPGQILDVDYEALVSEPERTTREIVSFCGLEWSPSCLDTHKVDRAVNTASFYQVRQPINTASVGKWRRYENQLGSFFKALGAT